jgi:hypothetical protein
MWRDGHKPSRRLFFQEGVTAQAYHRGHREHREKNKKSVTSVLSVVEIEQG